MLGNVKRSVSASGETGNGPGKLTKHSASLTSLADLMRHNQSEASESEDHSERGVKDQDMGPKTNNTQNFVRNTALATNHTSSTISSIGVHLDSHSQLPIQQIHIVPVDDDHETDSSVCHLRGQANQDTNPSTLSLTDSWSLGSNDSSNRTGATGTTGGQSVLNNWGWFEDVHGEQTEGGAPKGKEKDRIGNDSPGQNFDSGSNEKKGRGGGKKKGGLLQHSNYMTKPLNDIVPSTRNTEAGAMAVSAPNYVLEESISSQKLWKHTAGHRPPQPVEERAYFESQWAQNFEKSQVDYQVPADVLKAQSPISLSPFADGGFTGAEAEGIISWSNYNLAGHFNVNLFGGGGCVHQKSNKAAEADAAEATIYQRTLKVGHINLAREGNFNLLAPEGQGKLHGPHQKQVKKEMGDGGLTILLKGDNVFGTTVSKSFARGDPSQQTGTIDTISIAIASYRVVQSKKHGKFAQFLVVYREGSFQNTVGVWKRYSDFDALSRKVSAAHESCSSILHGIHPLAVHEDEDKEELPNAVTSWRLLKKRQRWYRCLDAGYLSLKVFLLERFLHDILFECSSPQVLQDFIGVDLRSSV
mmetsp:Transcript_26304/g.38998  ORF Transcript_26304/g.38998 Transcript_26304/m.38998 type:complete len:585 (-) Transcript_26304:453-2207(-)|eukprot:CAMPEP_0195523426 /NCGR_PEP_ID=MMETSP0794_2-20130614/22602_1 /TAXON_ID=515487 /ORGANISM="Stephanopyxis turris, Strain CCMP 815" /LENGTH=584 /DNA_ID=CAMNT_0040653429 /DNA_START=134 /DNA_END=1888 /DNA_ORIENTATION=+